MEFTSLRQRMQPAYHIGRAAPAGRGGDRFCIEFRITDIDTRSTFHVLLYDITDPLGQVLHIDRCVFKRSILLANRCIRAAHLLCAVGPFVTRIATIPDTPPNCYV